MDIRIEPGIYVVAVSGGVDSVSLLHMLRAQPGVKLIVAHFDHGIRYDSGHDRQFVNDLARHFNHPFIFHKANLGPGASEAAARRGRYEFLHAVRSAAKAKAIVTAHHQDDVLETAIINMLRGTNRRGISALKSTDVVLRPLLHVPKQNLIRYAQENQLVWREDSTNTDTTILRNYIRHHILPRLTPEDRERLLQMIQRLKEVNYAIDYELINLLHLQSLAGSLDRHWFIMLPHALAREAIAGWLRAHGITAYDKKALERLVAAAKTYHSGRQTDVTNQWKLIVTRDKLSLKNEG